MKAIRVIVTFSLLSFVFSACEKDDVDPKPPTAEAGNAQTIQLPVNTVTLTGTGSTTNGSIRGFLWSLISGPNVPIITKPSSGSTSVTGLVAGTYYF